MAFGRRSSRRSVLGGALAVTGLAGSGVAAGRVVDRGAAPGASAAVPMPALFLEHYTVSTANRGRGAQRKQGDQTLLRGTLTTEEGRRVGEIFVSSLTMPGPVHADSPHTPRMEIHNLWLHDGSILAMGTAFAQADVPNVYTIVGGSGRYADVRGAYRFDNNPSVANPSGRAAIRFHASGAPAV